MLSETSGHVPAYNSNPSMNAHLEYSAISSSSLQTMQGLPEGEKHKAMLITGTGAYKKPCVLCEFHKIRTKSGWYIYSRYKCDICNVALCTGGRGCFSLYHQYFSHYSNVIGESGHS